MRLNDIHVKAIFILLIGLISTSASSLREDFLAQITKYSCNLQTGSHFDFPKPIKDNECYTVSLQGNVFFKGTLWCWIADCT